MLPRQENLTIGKISGIVLGLPTLTLIIVGVIALVFGWPSRVFLLVTATSFLALAAVVFIFVQATASQWRKEDAKK